MRYETEAISIVICTKDRPRELERCLRSIARAGGVLPEVLVSDDSSCPADTKRVCAGFAGVRYVEGPRDGVGANRQNGASACRGRFLSFLDDDVVVDAAFLTVLRQCARRKTARRIYTGTVVEDGAERVPGRLTFLGHFTAAAPRAPETVNICANLFPAEVLEVARFDRSLRCYEDADFCMQAIRAGYTIEHVPALRSIHLPAEPAGSAYGAHRDFGRFYMSLKRYFLLQRRPLSGFAYLLIAPVHQIAHHGRHGRWRRTPGVLRDMGSALRAMRREAYARREIAAGTGDRTRRAGAG